MAVLKENFYPAFFICDLSRENVQQRFSVEQLKPLGTRWVPVGGVDESVGKAVGFFFFTR